MFIFAFISFALRDWTKKFCYDLCLRMLCLYYLLGVFWCHVLYLGLETILSLFLYMWGCVLISFIYMLLSSFPTTICWRDCLFFTIYSFLLCHRLIERRCVHLFLGSLFCSIDLHVCFCANIGSLFLMSTHDNKFLFVRGSVSELSSAYIKQ